MFVTIVAVALYVASIVVAIVKGEYKSALYLGVMSAVTVMVLPLLLALI